ncbi:MAG: DUF6514 family protein [Oscillospiraceae bacterium]|nr:DUF6514 family protein [Oscillospiraceae bacterium]
MREISVDHREAVDEQGRRHTYEYILLVGRVPISAQIACESYGACIRDGEGGCAQVPDITLIAGRIQALLDLLARNIVTPCTLLDVVEDWL